MIAITQLEEITYDLYKDSPKASFLPLLILIKVSEARGAWVSSLVVKDDVKHNNHGIRKSDTAWLISKGFLETKVVEDHRKINYYRTTDKIRECNPFDMPLLDDIKRVGSKTLRVHKSLSALCMMILLAVYFRKLTMQSEICSFCPVRSPQNIDRIIRTLTEIGILITVQANGMTGTKIQRSELVCKLSSKA